MTGLNVGNQEIDMDRKGGWQFGEYVVWQLAPDKNKLVRFAKKSGANDTWQELNINLHLFFTAERSEK